MTNDEMKKIIEKVYINYSSTACERKPAKLLELWMDVFGDMEYKEMDKCIMKTFKVCKRFPTIADILEHKDTRNIEW